ncbi:MAG: lamin tail domain-containing protein [Verrucomicrobiales bacterium]
MVRILIARATDGAGNWSGPITGDFTVGTDPASPENLVVSEIHYRPAGPSPEEDPGGLYSATDFEFIELMNIGATPINLTGVRIDGGIRFAFPDGYVLPAGARVVIVEDALLAIRYPSVPASQIVSEYDGNLSNDGEELALVSAESGDLRRFAYNNAPPW